MHTIENITMEPCDDSDFVKVERMYYLQEGVKKSWDVAQVHDSVAVLLYHTQRDAFVLVKQFRPPVYLKNKDGFTYELCAGIVDKNKPLAVIAQEEVHEECGYDVPLEKMRKITSFFTSVGFAGAAQMLYCAEIDETMRSHEGGGVDAEAIEVVFLERREAEAFIFDEAKAKTPGLMFAFMWFFANKT